MQLTMNLSNLGMASSTSYRGDSEAEELGSWSQILASLNSDGSQTNPLLEIFGVPSNSLLCSSTSSAESLSAAHKGDVSKEGRFGERGGTVEMIDISRRCNSEMLEEVSRESRMKMNNRPRKAHSAELHKISERKRRDNIRRKLRALQQLIPNSTKSDMFSVLDAAVKYLRALKLQTEMMSMDYQVRFVSLATVQSTQAPAVPQFLPLGMGMSYPAAPGIALMPIAPNLTAAQTQMSLVSSQDLYPQTSSFSNLFNYSNQGETGPWNASESSTDHQQVSMLNQEYNKVPE